MRRPLAFAFVLLVLPSACLPPSEQDLQTAQALVEMGDAFNQVQQELGVLQDQIDSLKWIAARQDTIIRQLANLAGVPVPR